MYESPFFPFLLQKFKKKTNKREVQSILCRQNIFFFLCKNVSCEKNVFKCKIVALNENVY